MPLCISLCLLDSHAMVSKHGRRGQYIGVSSVSPSREIYALNSDHQAWEEIMQPNESPCWPSLLFLLYFTDFYSYYPPSVCLGLFYPDFYSSLKLFIHYNNISFKYIFGLSTTIYMLYYLLIGKVKDNIFPQYDSVKKRKLCTYLQVLVSQILLLH